MEGVHNPHEDFVNQQWVEIGTLHQQQQHHHHYHQPQHQQQHGGHPDEFAAYGLVESSGFVPQDSQQHQFRLQPHHQQQHSVPIAPNYLGLPHWGQTMVPPPPSGVAPPHAQYIPPSSIAPLPQATAPTPIPATQSGHSTQSTSSPRRTLTDADRRRMCIFHEENPNVKQTEIGAMFGVERSTVSKVLRQKDKYLYPDDGSRSPVKRSKGKFPDIERALAVWAKNMRKQGVALTDMMIREKAKFFAMSVGISDSHFKANSQGWLEKFKQKNNLHSNGRGRSESDVTGAAKVGGGGVLSPRLGHSRTDSTPTLGSPMMQSSKSRDSHRSTDSPESFMDFGGFKNQQQVSGPASPTSPFFSPDQRADAIQGRIPHLHQRPRSQTFPNISVDPTYISPPPSSEPLTPKMLNQTVIPPSALASPAPDVPNPLASPHNTPLSHGAMTAGQAMPQTPTKEDARHALEVVMTYLRQQPVGYVEPDDYVVVGKLLARIGLDNGTIETDGKIGFPGLPP